MGLLIKKPISASLEFEITDNKHRTFLVQFESESLERNLIMNIIHDDLHIDVIELRIIHPVFYAAIKNKIKEVATKHYQSLKKTA